MDARWKHCGSIVGGRACGCTIKALWMQHGSIVEASWRCVGAPWGHCGCRMEANMAPVSVDVPTIPWMCVDWIGSFQCRFCFCEDSNCNNSKWISSGISACRFFGDHLRHGEWSFPLGRFLHERHVLSTLCLTEARCGEAQM